MCKSSPMYSSQAVMIGSLALVVCCSTSLASGQKVEVGFDKTAVFSDYKTYSWTKADQESNHPLLAEITIANVDHELQSKGLKRVEQDGDLLIMPSGGFGQQFGMAENTPLVPTGAKSPYFEPSTWAGPLVGGQSGLSPTVHEGQLVIVMADRTRSRVVWEGSVKEKIDPQRREEALGRIQKAVAKLFKDFPPQKK